MVEVRYTKGTYTALLQSGASVKRPNLEMLHSLREMRRRGNKGARIMLVERIESDGYRQLVPMLSDKLRR